MVVLIACSTEDDNKRGVLTDCAFEQIDENMDGIIDETERSIMKDCLDNIFSSKSIIENNIIGEWSLIGHGEGWVPSVSQPCGYIKITTEELIFKFQNAYIDTMITSGWEIEDVSTGLFDAFKLKIDSEFQEGLGMTNFCEQFIYVDATPSDGNMYLYEK